MGASKVGAMPKNDKTVLARQGFQALMGDVAHVIGGDGEWKRQVEESQTTPEPVKAARHAKLTRLPG